MPYSVSDYIHVLPETGSDERMHVLDDTCWCRPVLAARDVPGRRREYYLTHKVKGGTGPGATDRAFAAH